MVHPTSPGPIGSICHAVVQLVAPVLHAPSWVPVTRLILLMMLVGGGLLLLVVVR